MICQFQINNIHLLYLIQHTLKPSKLFILLSFYSRDQPSFKMTSVVTLAEVVTAKLTQGDS